MLRVGWLGPGRLAVRGRNSRTQRVLDLWKESVSMVQKAQTTHRRFGRWFARMFYRLSDESQREHLSGQVGDFSKYIICSLGADYLPSNLVDVLFLLTLTAKDPKVRFCESGM